MFVSKIKKSLLISQIYTRFMNIHHAVFKGKGGNQPVYMFKNHFLFEKHNLHAHQSSILKRKKSNIRFYKTYINLFTIRGTYIAFEKHDAVFKGKGGGLPPHGTNKLNHIFTFIVHPYTLSNTSTRYPFSLGIISRTILT